MPGAHTEHSVAAKGKFDAVPGTHAVQLPLIPALALPASHALQLVQQVREQFLDLLIDIGFLEGDVNINNIHKHEKNRNGHTPMVKAVLCAGLMPNLLALPQVIIA